MTRITIEVSLDPQDLTELERRDLEANAHLARRSVPDHLKRILEEHLQGFRVALKQEDARRETTLAA